MEQLTPDQYMDIDLKRYGYILQRWWWLLLLCGVLAGGTAYVVSTQLPSVYSASATLLVQQAPTTNVTDYTSLMTSERLARTYAQMITAQPVLEVAAAELGSTDLDLGRLVSVELIRDTQLLTIKAEAHDPAQAAAIANTVSRVFIAQTQALQEERYNNSLSNIQEQLDALQINIEQDQLALDALSNPTTGDTLAVRSRLEIALNSNRATYATLLNSREQMRLMAAQSSDNVILFDAARIPEAPIRPRKMVNTALAGFIA